MSYFNRSLKTDKNGIPVPQIFNPAVNDFQVLEGSGNQMPMFDAGAHARLDAIEQKIDGLIDGTTPASVQLTGSYVEYRGLSTDTKPAGERVGETYFEIDTANVYMWDGSHWRLI